MRALGDAHLLETTTPVSVLPPGSCLLPGSPRAVAQAPHPGASTNTAATAGRWAAAAQPQMDTSQRPLVHTITAPHNAQMSSSGHPEDTKAALSPSVLQTRNSLVWMETRSKIKSWGCPAASHPDCTCCRAAPLPVTGDRVGGGVTTSTTPKPVLTAKFVLETPRGLLPTMRSAHKVPDSSAHNLISLHLCVLVWGRMGVGVRAGAENLPQGTLGMLSTGQRAWLVVTLSMWSLPRPLHPISLSDSLHSGSFSPLSRS